MADDGKCGKQEKPDAEAPSDQLFLDRQQRFDLGGAKFIAKSARKSDWVDCVIGRFPWFEPTKTLRGALAFFRGASCPFLIFKICKSRDPTKQDRMFDLIIGVRKVNAAH